MSGVVSGLTVEEMCALPVGAHIREYITDTHSGIDHWAVYRKDDAGLWEIVDADPTGKPFLDLAKMLTDDIEHFTSESMWSSHEEQAVEGKHGTVTFSLAESPVDQAA